MSQEILIMILFIVFLFVCYLMYSIGYNKGYKDANYNARIITGKDAKRFHQKNKTNQP